MAFFRYQLALALMATAAWAELPEPSPVPLAANAAPAAAPTAEQPLDPEVENVRKALQALTPEQRKSFIKNMLRWSNLSSSEKKALRDRAEARRRQIQKEVLLAVRQSGVQFKEGEQARFERRFVEERRKLEERLRAESAEQRKAGLLEIRARLREEFAAAAPANAPAPAATPASAAPSAPSAPSAPAAPAATPEAPAKIPGL